MVNIIKTILSKPSFEKQSEYINKLIKSKRVITVHEYIDYIEQYDISRTLTLEDHYQHIQVLLPLIEEKSIPLFFIQIIPLYHYELSNYRLLQSNQWLSFFTFHNQLDWLQHLHYILVKDYIEERYDESLVLETRENTVYMKKIERKTMVPNFRPNSNIYQFFSVDFINSLVFMLYEVLSMIPRYDMIYILSCLYYFRLPYLFINNDCKEREKIRLYQLAMESVSSFTAQKASLYFQLLTRIFESIPSFVILFETQSERWLQESMCITFLSSLCKQQSLEYLSRFIQQIGSEMRCLLLQFTTLYQEDVKIQPRYPVQGRILYKNVYRLYSLLTEQNPHIHSLCSRYVSPTAKVFKMKNPSKSHRLIIDQEVISRIGCDQHQFSRQGLIEWSTFTKQCPEIFHNTSSFWCENCYLDYKQDCDVKMCSLFETKTENQSRKRLMEECIRKRNLYHHFCVYLPDEGHLQQIKEKETSIEKCKTILKKQT